LTATGGGAYAWTGPGGFTATGSPVTIDNVSNANEGKYKTTITSAGGCLHYDSVNVIVGITPVANAGTDVTIAKGAVPC